MVSYLDCLEDGDSIFDQYTDGLLLDYKALYIPKEIPFFDNYGHSSRQKDFQMTYELYG
jgi:hypothetical protein